MIPLMIDPNLGTRMRRTGRAAARLAPWLLAAFMVSVVLWGADSAATPGLFQSGLATPVPPATLAPTLTAPPILSTDTPTATVEVTPTLPGVVPTALLTSTVEPVLTVTSTAAPPPTPAPKLQETSAVPEAEGPTEPVPTAEGQRYRQDEAGLRFDWAMLFDSLALGLSYGWLCCGIFLALGLPVVFAILWIRSKRRPPSDE